MSPSAVQVTRVTAPAEATFAKHPVGQVAIGCTGGMGRRNDSVMSSQHTCYKFPAMPLL